MSDKIAKSPQIRFTGFIDAWEQFNLKDCFTERSERSAEGELISVTIDSGIVKASDLDRKDNSSSDKSNYKVVKVGDIAYNSMRMWQGASGFSPYDGILSPAYTVITPKENNNPKFFAYNFKRHEMIRTFQKNSQGLTSDTWNLKFPALSSIKIAVPSYGEQAKIVSFYEKLDHQLALHQRELELLKDTKKSLLQKMFPKNGTNVPEIRFAGFTDAWKQHELGGISEKVTEKNKDNNYSETLTNSAELGIITQRDFFDKDISNEKNLDGYYVVRPDDFVYNPRISNFAPVGPIKRNNLGRTGVMSPLYYVFRTHDVDKTYLEKYFSSDSWHKFMKLNGDSGARSDRFAIKDSVFREMPIPIPLVEEQAKIGTFFNQLDNLITLQQRELNSLKNLKKSLLQQMFV